MRAGSSSSAPQQGHFMPAELLDSQLALFEPLQSDEPGITLDATALPDAIIDRVLDYLATAKRR